MTIAPPAPATPPAPAPEDAARAETIAARAAGQVHAACEDCGCEEFCIDYLRDSARELIERDGVSVELFPANIALFLKGADAAPAHEWWEGLGLPETSDETPFQQALRATYTSRRD